MELTREQLYAQVWTTPANHLAKRLGVRLDALRNACNEHNIPTPGRKYWSKVRHGQLIAKPRLPKLNDPALQVVRLKPVSEHRPPPSVRHRPKTSSSKAQIDWILVPQTLKSPCDLVRRTARSLLNAIPDQCGIVKPQDTGCLDVAVGAESIDRAMRILDALLAAFRAEGACVSVKAESPEDRDNPAAVPRYPPHTTVVEFQGQRLVMWLCEHVGDREVRLTPPQQGKEACPTREKYPSGLLSLVLQGEDDRYIEKRWSELYGTKLENSLHKVMAWLDLAPEQLATRQKMLAEWHRQFSADYWQLDDGTG